MNHLTRAVACHTQGHTYLFRYDGRYPHKAIRALTEVGKARWWGFNLLDSVEPSLTIWAMWEEDVRAGVYANESSITTMAIPDKTYDVDFLLTDERESTEDTA